MDILDTPFHKYTTNRIFIRNINVGISGYLQELLFEGLDAINLRVDIKW